MRQLKKAIFLLLWGFFVLSTWSSKLFVISELNFIEIPIVVLLIVFWRYPVVVFIKQEIAYSQLFLGFVSFIFVFSLIGILKHGDIVSVMRDARGLIFFSVAFCFGYYKKWHDLQGLFWLLMISFCSDIILSVYFPRDPIVSLFKNYYYLFGISVIIAIPWMEGRFFQTLLGICIASMVSVSSGFRTGIGLVVSTIIICYMTSTWYYGLVTGRYRYFLASALFSTIFLVLVILNYDVILFQYDKFVLMLDPVLYIQLISKSEALFAGTSASDTFRFGYFSTFYNNWDSYLLPYGLGYSTLIFNIQVMKDAYSYGGNPGDNGYIWIVIHYSLIVALALFGIYLRQAFVLIRRPQKTKIELTLIVLIVPFLMSNFTSSFLAISWQTVFTGILLGIMFKKRELAQPTLELYQNKSVDLAKVKEIR